MCDEGKTRASFSCWSNLPQMTPAATLQLKGALKSSQAGTCRATVPQHTDHPAAVSDDANKLLDEHNYRPNCNQLRLQGRLQMLTCLHDVPSTGTGSKSSSSTLTENMQRHPTPAGSV
jgi:hypothetical protein